MLKYPISTILWLSKITIKDKIKDALKLHNNIDLRLTITVKDKDGKIIKQHKQHSHSFVSNFLSILASSLATYYFQSITSNSYGYYYRTTNGDYAAYSPNEMVFNRIFDLNDSANDSSYGIVVGTGTATPTPNDYALGNQIVNGTGTGQLVYGAHQFNPAPQTIGSSTYVTTTSTPTSGILPVSGNTTSWQIERTFQNQSGASITVSEVGIYIDTINGVALIVHDLLSSPITVPNNAVLTIIYTISVST